MLPLQSFANRIEHRFSSRTNFCAACTNEFGSPISDELFITREKQRERREVAVSTTPCRVTPPLGARGPARVLEPFPSSDELQRITPFGANFPPRFDNLHDLFLRPNFCVSFVFLHILN